MQATVDYHPGPYEDSPASLPTEEDLEVAREALQGAVEALVTARWQIWRIARSVSRHDSGGYAVDPRDGVPTFEDIGRMLAFTVWVESHMEELSGYASDLRGLVDDLEGVRTIDASEAERGEAA